MTKIKKNIDKAINPQVRQSNKPTSDQDTTVFKNGLTLQLTILIK